VPNIAAARRESSVGLAQNTSTIEVYESIERLPTLVATARDADVVRLPPFDVDLSLGTWWKSPSATSAASP